MNIKRTIIAAVVSLALVAVVAPGVGQADVISDLLAQIAALQAQLNALIAQSGGTTGGSMMSGVCAGVSFTRNMTVGATGSDVQCLQYVLNLSATTRVASTGAGSPGNETTYFGPLTLAAVKVYQQEHGWTPANQVGPLTRGALNAQLATMGGTTGGTTGGTVIPTGAGLTVSLASTTPVSGTVVATQGLAPLTRLTFVNGDNAPVKVTSLSLTRIGISADTSLANVYLLNGAVRLTDAASVSSGKVNFNDTDADGLFTVPSGSSVTITVAADLSATSGETIGLALVAMTDVTTNASSVKGLFPANGNLMTVASATLAGVSFAATTTPSTNASLNPQNDFTVWQNSTVVTTRSVNVTRLSFRMIGSADYSSLQNFRLNIDGVNVGNSVASLDSNGYVTFDLTTNPYSLQTGTRVIKLVADVIGGSNRTFNFSIRVAADANFVDSQYGVNVAPVSATTGTSFTLSDVTAGTQTVSTGTLTIARATDSPSGNVTNNAANAVLARWKLTAAGEKVKVMTLNVGVDFTDSDNCSGYSGTTFRLRNGALYANGVQVGSTTAMVNTSSTSSGTQFNFGSSLVVDPLTPTVLELRGDLYDSGNSTNCVSSGDTLTGRVVSGTSNAQGMVSLSTVSTPASDVTGNSLTVAVGALTLSKYSAYTNQTVVAPQTAIKLGHFTLTNGTVEPINLNTIYADLTLLATHTTNLWVKYGSSQTSAIASPSATSLANSYSISRQLGLGETIDIIVYGDVDSTIAASTGSTSVKVLGTTANSGQSVSAGLTTGQSITWANGSASASADGSTPVSQAIAGGQEVVAGKYRFTATNDSYTISKAKFTVQGNNGAVITTASLYDGSTLLGTVPFDSTNNWFLFTGLNVAVSSNSTKILTAKLNLATPYTDGTTVTTGKNVALTLYGLEALNSQGQVKDDGTGFSGSGITLSSGAGNYVYVYKSIPTFTLGSVSGQGTSLSSGSTTDLYNFTVAADSHGPVALRQMKFTVTVNDINTGAAASLSTFKFFRGSTDLTQAGTVYIVDGSGNDITGSTSIASGTVVVIFYPEEVVPAGSSYTYTLKATPTGFTTSTSGADSVTTSMPGVSTPAGVSAGADAASYYLSSTGNSNTVTQLLFTAAAGSGSGTAANTIWSDYSAQSHNATSSASSADWFNGYLINNLPLSSIGVIAQ